MKFSSEEGRKHSHLYFGEKRVLTIARELAYKGGGAYTMEAILFWVMFPEMAKSRTIPRLPVWFKRKNVQFTRLLKVADWRAYHYSQLASVEEIKPALAADKFQQITLENQECRPPVFLIQLQLRLRTDSELKACRCARHFLSEKLKPAMPKTKRLHRQKCWVAASSAGSLTIRGANTGLVKRQKVTADFVK